MSTQEKREKMLSMVEDWKASGLTQKAFSALHGIKVATLGIGKPILSHFFKSH